MKNIGIIGQGFVGTAVNEGLAKHYHIETFDIVKLVNPSIVELLLNNTCVLSAKPIERSVITSTLVENKVPVTL